MSSVEKARAQKSALIQDLKEVSKKYEGQQVTRDLYREQGVYSERLWHKHFSRFKDFVSAAGIETVSTPDQPETQAFKEQGNTWEITLPKTQIDSVDALLAYYKVDKSLWAVEEFTINTWQMGAKDNDGNVVVTPLYQVKAKLKKRKGIEDVKDEIARLKELAKATAPVPVPLTSSMSVSDDEGNLLEINISDLHAGKMAWSKETGYGNYDTKIAISTYWEAFGALLQRVSHFKFDRVLLVTGNDLLHSDDLEGRTTSGTYVNTDGRYHKTFIAVRDMLIESVERLRRIAPVTVISCPGNHDTLAAWHVADSLECYFHNFPDVQIDNSPKTRKYYQFGQVMLMFTHGHASKRSDIGLTMAAEEPKMWGATKYREAHTGHLHQVRTEEQHGVRVRVLPSLCETDAWHAAKAFTNNLRSAEAYVWNKDEGLVAQAFYGAD